MVETVINQNDGFVSIIASGGETELDFDFPIYEKSHLKVILTRSSVDTDLVLDTDYTIATDQLEVSAGGTAVLISPAIAADVYTLLLNVPEERTTDFSNAGDFRAATLNRELDLEQQQIQQLRRDLDKSARLPETSILSELFLPTPEASQLIGWNATADGLINYAGASGVAVTSYIATLLDDATASDARTTLGVTQANLGITAAAQTVLDDTTVADMVNTLGGATSTGTGGLARKTSPVFVTPTLGVAAATSINFGGSALSDYLASGTWTPSPTGLTVVGTPTYTGRYSRIGNIVFCSLNIFSTTTTASTAGTTYFTGLPVTPAFDGATGGAGNLASGAGLSGAAVVFAGTQRIYTPTWSATANIQVNFWYLA